MKTNRSKHGFSLVENVLAIALVSLLGLSLGGMMILAGKLTRMAREEITAAEIVETKLEHNYTSGRQNTKASVVASNVAFRMFQNGPFPARVTRE